MAFTYYSVLERSLLMIFVKFQGFMVYETCFLHVPEKCTSQILRIELGGPLMGGGRSFNGRYSLSDHKNLCIPLILPWSCRKNYNTSRNSSSDHHRTMASGYE